MIGDCNKFLSLREDRTNNVKFSNDALGNIMAKETITFSMEEVRLKTLFLWMDLRTTY